MATATLQKLWRGEGQFENIFNNSIYSNQPDLPVTETDPYKCLLCRDTLAPHMFCPNNMVCVKCILVSSIKTSLIYKQFQVYCKIIDAGQHDEYMSNARFILRPLLRPIR